MVEHTEKGERQHKPKLGKTLVSKGYITEEELDKALSEQRVRLGEVLIRSDRITAEQLTLPWLIKRRNQLNLARYARKWDI